MEQQRKYFGTDGIRGKTGIHPITPDFMLKLGWSIGNILRERYQQPVSVLVGKDTRISGYLLESALEAGFIAAGVDIKLVGPLPTPAIAYLTQYHHAHAGIMISASHNPYSDNGIKLFSEQGFKLQDETELLIEQRLTQAVQTVRPEELGKAIRIDDAITQYANFCLSTLPQWFNLNGIKCVIDCAHGASYQVAPRVFSMLGAKVIPLAVTPNGFNINQQCGSTAPQMLQKAVLQHQADLGIAFDGDSDRVIMVDHHGEIVDGDEILFIIAKYAQSKQQLKGGVVATQISNLGLEDALRKLDIDFARCQVGDRYVLNALQQRCWQIGGEVSGHIVHLGITTTGDAIISALQVLLAMHASEQNLHTLKQGMYKFPQTTINVDMPNKLQSIEHPQLLAAVEFAENSLQGKGRVLLRPSGTEPYIRVMVEGEQQQQVQNIAKNLAVEVSSFLQNFEGQC